MTVTAVAADYKKNPFTLVYAGALAKNEPGKVNIQLSVGRLRPDGYHPLASVFPAVALHEDVTVVAGEPGSGIAIEDVTGPQADEVPRDGSNLVWRAASFVPQVCIGIVTFLYWRAQVARAASRGEAAGTA